MGFDLFRNPILSALIISRNHLKKYLIIKQLYKNIQILCNYKGIKNRSKHIADKPMTIENYQSSL